MCPIPLLIFLIRGKECFICREGDELGHDALLHFGMEDLIAHRGSLLTRGRRWWTQSWDHLFPAGNSFTYASCCKSSAWKTFFFFFSVGLVFLALLKMDLGREFKSLPHQCWEFSSAMKIRVRNYNGGCQGNWKGNLALIEACQELDWGHRNKNNEVSTNWDC